MQINILIEKDCETLAVVPGTETTDFDMSGFELHEDNDAESKISK